MELASCLGMCKIALSFPERESAQSCSNYATYHKSLKHDVFSVWRCPNILSVPDYPFQVFPCLKQELPLVRIFYVLANNYFSQSLLVPSQSQGSIDRKLQEVQMVGMLKADSDPFGNDAAMWKCDEIVTLMWVVAIAVKYGINRVCRIGYSDIELVRKFQSALSVLYGTCFQSHFKRSAYSMRNPLSLTIIHLIVSAC